MNLSTYIKEIQKELKLTTFPSQQIVINFTLFVVIFTAVMAVYLGALDVGFGDVILKGINNAKANQPIVASTTISTSTVPATINPITVPTPVTPTNNLLNPNK